MIFRTLNAARSAFVTAKFLPSFFETYESSKEIARCKVFLKVSSTKLIINFSSLTVLSQPMVAVFKNTSTVQSFTIRFDTDSSFLEIDFDCKDGMHLNFHSEPNCISWRRPQVFRSASSLYMKPATFCRWHFTEFTTDERKLSGFVDSWVLTRWVKRFGQHCIVLHFFFTCVVACSCCSTWPHFQYPSG